MTPGSATGDAAPDPGNLQRFATAQDEAGTYVRALAELRRGRKSGHWMWFVFPQLTGLGTSPTSRRYAIASLEQARVYLAHPVLGPRLRECAAALLDLPESPDTSAVDVLGVIDAMKLRSSATLFARAAPGEPKFTDVLDRFFDGAPDPETDRRL